MHGRMQMEEWKCHLSLSLFLSFPSRRARAVRTLQTCVSVSHIFTCCEAHDKSKAGPLQWTPSTHTKCTATVGSKGPFPAGFCQHRSVTQQANPLCRKPNGGFLSSGCCQQWVYAADDLGLEHAERAAMEKLDCQGENFALLSHRLE